MPSDHNRSILQKKKKKKKKICSLSQKGRSMRLGRFSKYAWSKVGSAGENLLISPGFSFSPETLGTEGAPHERYHDISRPTGVISVSLCAGGAGCGGGMAAHTRSLGF